MNDLAEPPVQEQAAPDVDVRALAAPPVVHIAPAMVRRRSVFVAVAVATVLALLAGGGVWWHHAVTADAGLEFYGGPNVFRNETGGDHTGIREVRNLLGSEVDVEFVPGGRLYVFFGLYNGGPHDVRIEAAPEEPYYYWAFDGMALSTDPDDGFVGVRTHYEPFRPFTLQRGETREVRLEYRLAGCDPAELQTGGYSTIRSLPLRYRILGITRTRPVPFRETAVALQAMGPCQHPITHDEGGRPPS